MRIIGFTRVRNESLILKDTLDHFGQFCDSIYLFNDASTDDTREIAMSHPKVKHMLNNLVWSPGLNRNWDQRGSIYNLACVIERPTNKDFFLCFDADERLEGVDRSTVELLSDTEVSGILMRLVDFYITDIDRNVSCGGSLSNFRKFCGTEYRDTLMFFRWNKTIKYTLSYAREPTWIDYSKCIKQGFVKHYGKAISVEDFERRCDYYTKYFPDPYKIRWEKRKGKAIHTVTSDYGTPLVLFDLVVKGKVDLGPCLYTSGDN